MSEGDEGEPDVTPFVDKPTPKPEPDPEPKPKKPKTLTGYLQSEGLKPDNIISKTT
jgi:hypothetical protein